MAEEFSTEVVKRFTGEIASRLGKASALATTAQTLNSQGLTDHAFDALRRAEKAGAPSPLQRGHSTK